MTEFLLPELCRQFRVEVTDPRLAQRGDLLDGGHGEALACEGDHTVRLTGMIQDAAGKVKVRILL